MTESEKKLVESLAEVEANIIQFNQEISENDRMLRYSLPHYRLWCYSQRLNMFAPGRYIAFKGVNQDNFKEFAYSVKASLFWSRLGKWFTETDSPKLVKEMVRQMDGYGRIRKNIAIHVLTEDDQHALTQTYAQYIDQAIKELKTKKIDITFDILAYLASQSADYQEVKIVSERLTKMGLTKTEAYYKLHLQMAETKQEVDLMIASMQQSGFQLDVDALHDFTFSAEDNRLDETRLNYYNEAAYVSLLIAESNRNGRMNLHHKLAFKINHIRKNHVVDIEVLTKLYLAGSEFGQAAFAFWKTCRVCEIDDKRLLTASHIKPWVYASRHERLDIYNSLILCPNHYTLFDKGLLSFTNLGEICLADSIDDDKRRLLGVDHQLTIKLHNKAEGTYWNWHRRNIFEPAHVNQQEKQESH